MEKIDEAKEKVIEALRTLMEEKIKIYDELASIDDPGDPTSSMHFHKKAEKVKKEIDSLIKVIRAF